MTIAADPSTYPKTSKRLTGPFGDGKQRGDLGNDQNPASLVTAKSLLLKHFLCPGDVLVMTAAVESLAKQYPGRFRISVDTTCPEIWENNPHIERWDGSGQGIELQYPAIHQSHLIRTGHFMGAFVQNLGQQLNLPLQLQVNRPSLYLSEQEKRSPLIEGEYFVVNAGVKNDCTNKAWGRKNYQAVVNHFKGKLTFVQIGEKHHKHEALDNVVSLIGQTKPRELFRLCYHSLGGIGPTTFLQHIFAALEKFYVCILGGREPKTWADYPTQTTFSTMGQLACCKESACWKARTIPLGDGDGKDQSLCSLPVLSGAEMIPACMEAITPEMIINAIETYIRYGKRS
jgi:ADP-heptose:LPS heptosyltransferase